MTGASPTVYRPNRQAAAVYAELYELYRTVHDAFGTSSFQGNLHGVMKNLIAIRDRERRR
jgi:L-ribulokinase